MRPHGGRHQSAGEPPVKRRTLFLFAGARSSFLPAPLVPASLPGDSRQSRFPARRKPTSSWSAPELLDCPQRSQPSAKARAASSSLKKPRWRAATRSFRRALSQPKSPPKASSDSRTKFLKQAKEVPTLSSPGRLLKAPGEPLSAYPRSGSPGSRRPSGRSGRPRPEAGIRGRRSQATTTCR